MHCTHANNLQGDDAHATKKQKLAASSSSERGFAKGTGYSGDTRSGGATKLKVVKGKEQRALELLRDLFDEKGENGKIR